MYKDIVAELDKLSSKEKAKVNAWFFKTGKGEYGYGDKFIGVIVPDQRIVVKKFLDIDLDELKKLLDSKIHEHRLTGLMILVEKYKLDDDKERIVNFYLKNLKAVNNWDLVDTSAWQILGEWLLDKDKHVLYEFSKSDNLWKRRIAIISTYAFIRQKKFKDTLKISTLLMNDKHDLIHKAVGWMLRELGKKDSKVLDKFLKKYSKKMPRTMLRYSIEKFSKNKRNFYMKK